ncbi:MAG: type II secretion system F family protein [Syntrophomonas sp.]
MESLIVLFAFISVSSLILAITKGLSKADLYQERLKQINNNVRPEREKGKRITTGGLVTAMGRLVAPRSVAQKVQNDLMRAGIPLKAQEYLVISFTLILVVPIISFVITKQAFLAFVLIILGLLLPRFWVKSKKEKRLQAINMQLGDTLVIMANALRAGFGFQQAMDTVRREMPAPISSEFAWTLREMNLGVSQEEALLNMGNRVGSDDLDMVITGIIIQRQVGGNLAEILENISGTIRERDRIKRNIKVLTAQGRMSGIVIGLLPVALVVFMVAVNPSYFMIMVEKPVGIMMLVGAGVTEVIGVLIIKKMVTFDF